MNKKGIIIVFEGIDQSGKGTQAKLFIDRLKEMGLSSAYLHFHDLDTPLGKEIQLFLEGKRNYSPIVRQLLFAANRYERNEDIGDFIKSKDFIVIDRYIPSGLAYGIANGMELDWMLEIEKQLFQPDIVVLLDITSNTSYSRKPPKDRDIYEKDLAFLEKVRDSYLGLAKKFNWLIINGEDKTEEVKKSIWKGIIEELNKRGMHI
ncbi:MAG: dTMP kinase [Firmicutes bacterium]|nr:dTMP kinase [Bacillota bacterium]